MLSLEAIFVSFRPGERNSTIGNSSTTISSHPILAQFSIFLLIRRDPSPQLEAFYPTQPFICTYIYFLLLS